MDYCPHCMEPATGQVCPSCGKPTQWQAPTSQLPVGTLLRGSGGRVYQVGAAKGQGGFGITYAAMDLRTNTRVAVKEYYPSRCASRDSMTRVIWATGQQDSFDTGLRSFLQEAKMLSSVGALDSVVSVRDHFEGNGTAYIVMEYVDGSALNDVVATRGPMRKQELFPILQPLLRDLGILHRAGVIHRDISPDNLILTREGKLKLLDFGSARSTSSGKAMTVMLKAGFSPLEQYQSKGQGPYTDVYAMAGTIYYCLTGKIPPTSVDRIQLDELRMPNDFGAGLTQKEQDALVWGLSVHAHQRPQNVEAFANALLSSPDGPVFEPPVRQEPQPTYPQPAAYQQTAYQTAPQTSYQQPAYPQPPQKSGFGKGLAIGIGAAAAAVVLLVTGLALGGAFSGGKSSDPGDEPDRPARAEVQVTTPVTRPVATQPTQSVRTQELLVTDEGYLYYIANGEAVIAGYEGDDIFLSFPDELDGCPVTALDPGCLKGNTHIQTVLLPTECTHIRAEAFSGCTDLRRISCYSTISVDPSAFSGCARLRAVIRMDGDDVSGWPLPGNVQVYTVGQETGIGTLSSVYVDDNDVIYGVTHDQEAVIMRIPGSVSYLEVPEDYGGFPVLWMAEGALDSAPADLKVLMCSDMGFDPSLLDLADWDFISENDFSFNWYATCVICEDANEDLTGHQVVPDRLLVQACLIRAQELSEHFDFNTRPDGTDTPTLLDALEVRWSGDASAWHGKIEATDAETFDAEFGEAYDGIVEMVAGPYDEADPNSSHDAAGVAFWDDPDTGITYIYSIATVW